MIQAIHHVQLTVPGEQIEEAMAFYRDTLGLALSPHRPPEWGNTGYWFTVGDREIHLSKEAGLSFQLGQVRSRAHVAFKVDDAGAWRAKFEAMGHWTRDEPDLPGYVRFHTHDPFGNTLEFIQPTKLTLEVDRAP